MPGEAAGDPAVGPTGSSPAGSSGSAGRSPAGGSTPPPGNGPGEPSDAPATGPGPSAPGDETPDQADVLGPVGGGGPDGAGRETAGVDDLDARFLAIVSGIAPSMQWHADPDEHRRDPPATRRPPARLVVEDDDEPGDVRDRPEESGPPLGPILDRPRPSRPDLRPDAGARPFSSGSTGAPDTADERARRREARRQERADELAAFQAEKAERERQYAEDDAHYEPPPPPPLPRPKGRTVAALLAIAAGVVLLARPTLLALNQDVSIVLAVLIILGGLGVLVAGLHRPAPDGSDGWDDGARL